MNLFIPSELDWTDENFRLTQETKYPELETVTLTVKAARLEPLSLRVRIPNWLRAAPSVRLNGEALDASAEPGSYLTLRRSWKPGDRIEMRFPMHLHAEAMPDDRSTQAFLYGPVVLAGDLGGNGLTESHIIGPNLRVGAPNAQQHAVYTRHNQVCHDCVGIICLQML